MTANLTRLSDSSLFHNEQCYSGQSPRQTKLCENWMKNTNSVS